MAEAELFLILYQRDKAKFENDWWKSRDIYISPWNPRFTMARDLDDRRQLTAKLKLWTAEWWGQKGYNVFFANDDTGRFGVQKYENTF